MSEVEANGNPDKLEDSALNLERRKIKREEGAKAAKALESLDVKPAEEVKGADVDLIVSNDGLRNATLPNLAVAGGLFDYVEFGPAERRLILKLTCRSRSSVSRRRRRRLPSARRGATSSRLSSS